MMKHKILPVFLLLILLVTACRPRQASTSGSETTEITSPEQQSIVNYQDKLTLVVPPNTVPAGSQVSISTVKGAPEFAYTGVKTLGTYEVKIGDQASFSWPLQIQFKYDPLKLDREISAADQLTVAYLDVTSQRWVETDYLLDAESYTLTVTTDHLSLWGLFGLEDHVVVSTGPHFKIYFDDRLNAPLLTDKPSGAGLIYDFVAQVRSALEEAYENYQKTPGTAENGFKMPEMTRVYIDDWGPEKTAAWGWFSKSIEIPTSYSDLDELKQDVAHELFHAVQNQYAAVVTMNANRWFMEGSADYAAANIGTSNGLKTTLELDFIKKPLNDLDDKHMYRVAHFLQFIDQKGLDFKDLAEAILAAGGDALGGMEGFADARGTDLQDVYADFAQAFIFSDSLQRQPLPSSNPLDLADYKGSFDKSQTILSTQVNIPGEYAARLVGYEITDDASVAPYKVFLSMLDQSSLVQVQYILEKDGQRTIGDLESAKPVEVEIQGGTKVYFLVTNANENQGTVTVALEQNPTILSTSYSNSFNALIYNQDFTGGVSFTVSSTAPFEVVREMVAPNKETFILDLRIPDLKKGAEIYAEAGVSGIGNMNQASNLTPQIVESYWYVTDVGEIMGGSAAASLPPNSTQGVSMNFSILIDCTNNLVPNSSAVRCGSGTVVMIRIGP